MTSSDVQQIQPISRTYQYRKVMKPMLERKRRARINRCLDELKELMLSSLQADGENVSKLEKADILELTVNHLRKLRQQRRLSLDCPDAPVADSDRFRAGFTHCASEVSKCLASTIGVDVKLGTQLMTHLGHRLNEMEKIGSTFQNPLSIRTDAMTPPPSSPSSMSSCESNASSFAGYNMPLTPTSTSSRSYCQSPSSPSFYVDAYNPVDMSIKPCASSPVWRPW